SIELTHTSGAGNVDFCEVVANYIEAYEMQPFFFKHRPYLCTNPAVTLSKFTAFSAPACGDVTTRLAGHGNACQSVINRFAINHENALVAVGDFGNETLNHCRGGAMFSEYFSDYGKVWVAFFNTENVTATHAV